VILRRRDVFRNPLRPQSTSRNGLPDLGSSRDRLREHLRVDDLKGQDHRRAADRGRGEHTQLGNSSAGCSGLSPIRSTTDINRPSGVGIRLTSPAPKASL
jgi:hypothetical protein